MAVFSGGSVNVTCSVTRHDGNRWLRIGVVNTWDSTKQLEGGKAAKTWRLIFDHLPCEAHAAYCVVQRANGEVQVAEVPIRMLDCE
jgi:hypothetical protein